MKRRDFLLAGSALGAVAATGQKSSGQVIYPLRQEQQPERTGENALKIVIDGNERFVTGKSVHPRENTQWLKRLTKGQDPIATILACSDSRVPLELLFDMGFGDLFTIRVAGNVVSRYGIGSMEYAQHHLDTPLYIVLGHEGCGAVTAKLLPEEKRITEPKGVRELLDLVQVGDLDENLDDKTRLNAAVENNARNSARIIYDLDPKKEGFQLREGQLLVTAVYELSTGKVRILEKLK